MNKLTPDLSPTVVGYGIPVIQFRKLDDFIADLAAGRVEVIYHDLPSTALGEWYSVFRAVVRGGGELHIASLAMQLSTLVIVDERGVSRPAGHDEMYAHQAAEHEKRVEHIRERLTEIGLLPDALRPGSVGVAHWVITVNARRGKDEPAKTVRVARPIGG